ncbi:MAG TPA: MBL fold metallo-hydrolase, partial [Chitinophagaceae bacterium]|nr:MBL fold metallo-hydrolase [Chitinophagaceae bacterium]
MLEIKSFTFNPFQENTYILHNEQKRALIIDPGAYFKEEKNALLAYITEKELVPLRLLNTHCHLDHVFSNKLVAEKYNLLPEINKAESDILASAVSYGLKYELSFEASPAPKKFLNEKDTIKLGEDSLSIFLAPGHSPGSICFYCEKQNFLIGGDVLFRESIGRTDLP